MKVNIHRRPTLIVPTTLNFYFRSMHGVEDVDVTTVTLFDEEEDVNFYTGDDDSNSSRSRTLTKSTFMSMFRDTTNVVLQPNNIPNDGTTQENYDFHAKALLASSDLAHDDAHHHGRRVAQSNCRCPIDAKFRAVTEEEMINAFNATLLLFNDNLSDLSVEDVIEIEDVQCSADVNNFDTVINVEFLTEDSVISDKIATTLKENLIRSYNSLSERFCDPFFRYLETADNTSANRQNL
jgi:hypothetical protein